MPAVSSFLIEPIWDQFQALIAGDRDVHPLGCHRPRISDRNESPWVSFLGVLLGSGRFQE